MSDFWNSRYNVPEYVYGTEPNHWFAGFIDGVRPGRLLLPGEGEGRNAVYAAGKGFEVVAVDGSIIARDKALKLAEMQGVGLEYYVGDILDFVREQPDDSYDAVSLIFVHFHPDQRKAVHHQLPRLMKNGGILHLLAFGREQINKNSGGPKDPAMLYDRTEILNDFPGIEIVVARDIEEILEEGPFHNGYFHGIELILRKPLTS